MLKHFNQVITGIKQKKKTRQKEGILRVLLGALVALPAAPSCFLRSSPSWPRVSRQPHVTSWRGLPASAPPPREHDHAAPPKSSTCPIPNSVGGDRREQVPRGDIRRDCFIVTHFFHCLWCHLMNFYPQ